jgi:DNA invertase Pin-like site-specific DNA recombinase
MKELHKAVGYMRTSSISNVGNDKDSDKRQRQAISIFAKQSGYMIVDYWYDAAISGADPITDRPAFTDMLRHIQTYNIKTIIIESADRLARDLLIQLTTHDLLKGMGVQLIAANAPDYFIEETATAVLVRQMLGAIAQFQKTQIVSQLAAARNRKRALTGRCGGNRPITDIAPDAVEMAKYLSRKRKRKLSLAKIALKLAEAGYLSKKGKIYSAQTISTMIAA